MEFDLIDEIELRAQMRQMYKEVGFSGSIRCLAEILKSGEILTEILQEELDKQTRIENIKKRNEKES